VALVRCSLQLFDGKKVVLEATHISGHQLFIAHSFLPVDSRNQDLSDDGGKKTQSIRPGSQISTLKPSGEIESYSCASIRTRKIFRRKSLAIVSAPL